MDKEKFYSYLKNQNSLNREAVAFLDDTLKMYPYLYPAYVLKLKALQGESLYKEEVSKVSALSPNRYVLFFILNPPPKVELSEQNRNDIEPIEDIDIAEKNEPKDETLLVESSEAPFELENNESESTEIIETDVNEEIPEATSLRDDILLDIAEPEATIEDSEEEENFLSPQLYTLEIPKGHIEHNALESLALDIQRLGKGKKEDKLLSDQVDRPSEELFQLTDDEVVESSLTKDEPLGKDHKEKQDTLISAFIDTNPRIVPKMRPEDLPEEQEDISLDSLKEPEDAITEALAAIYIAQGLYDKAMKIYEKLSLKYPEKRAYFAGQIEKIKNQPNK